MLSEILARKEKEVASLPLFAAVPARRRSLVTALMSRYPSLIAEIKPVSPTRGRLIELHKMPMIVDVYNRHAQAISVLCDTATFGGGFDLLASVRKKTDLPLLAKDFILDVRQIDAAAFHGADAILLIVSLLEHKKLRQCVGHAIALGLDVLLELHASEDVTSAHVLCNSLTEQEKAHIVLGINNRDLQTQTMDLRTTERIVGLMPPVFPIVSESGIVTSDDVQRLQPYVQGFLIGSAILESDDSDAFIRSLFPQS